MGIPERKEREKKEMKDIILKTAMILFVEEGFDNVSLRKIAQKIQYSPSTIYLYFEDKESIFFELHNEGFDRLYSKQLTVQHIDNPVERLLAHGKIYLEFAFAEPDYYNIMFMLHAPVEKIQKNNDWRCGNRSFDLLRHNIAQCMEVGYFTGKNERQVSFFFWSMVHGMASLQLRLKPVLNELIGQDRESLFSGSLDLMRSMIH